MKQVLEGQAVSRRTQLHLDRWPDLPVVRDDLPVGVPVWPVARHWPRGGGGACRQARADRLLRALLRAVVPHRRRFGLLLGLARALRPALPGALRRLVPRLCHPGDWPAAAHGPAVCCCWKAACSRSRAADQRRDGARAGPARPFRVRTPTAGCCGAVSHHLAAAGRRGRSWRRNIDAWWPHVEAGVEAIVVNASGCGVVVKDYGHLLADDPAYAERAARVRRSR